MYKDYFLISDWKISDMRFFRVRDLFLLLNSMWGKVTISIYLFNFRVLISKRSNAVTFLLADSIKLSVHFSQIQFEVQSKINFRKFRKLKKKYLGKKTLTPSFEIPDFIVRVIVCFCNFSSTISKSFSPQSILS